ncbi:hypothetical protein AGMMS49965_15760 [Bacteroidia bacterium]|nr:hypothetical protein AGMMS49965_15760 [Bacteroidia bacterium]
MTITKGLRVPAMALVLGVCCLSSCDLDAIDEVGAGIQPDGDKIMVVSDSFDVSGTTVSMDNIYAKSIYGMLGRLSDPVYGDIASSYACQFYPTAGFDGIVEGAGIDSVQLKILYATFIGDSVAPMGVSIYPVTKLPANYYTDDPTPFYDKNTVWGTQAYSARDMSISDSAYAATEGAYYRVVSVDLPKEIGEKLLLEYNKDERHGAYASPEAMAEHFPGVYVAPTFGTGSMLNIEKTEIYVYYKREYHLTASDGESDSIATATSASVLTVTKEMIQLNRYANSNDAHLLPENPDRMYLKTPAGVCAQLTIDIKQIKEKMGNRKLSNVSLELNAEPKAYTPGFSLGFPGTNAVNTLNLTRSKLLLLVEDSVQTFFEGGKIADNRVSYLSTFNATAYSYQYANIANVVQRAIDQSVAENSPPQPLRLLLIPVQVSYYVESSYYGTTYTDHTVAHYLAPSAVTLKKAPGDIKIRVVASDVK